MKIGIVYPQIEMRGDPGALAMMGRAAEASGFDHFLMYDHVLGAVHEGRNPPLAGPYDEHDTFHDPFVAFGFLSAITQRIEFFTGVLILPQRQTALVARQATDVDLLSNGRLNLGVGVGWNPVEYDALGQSFTTRGKRLDEQIELLRRFWTGDVIEWQGQFDRVDRAALSPKPKRRIPIFCGGSSAPAFRRAAKMADGFIYGGQSMPSLIEQWRDMQDLLKSEGRTPSDFLAHALIVNERFEAQAVDDAADGLKMWRDAGGSYASIVSLGQGFHEPEQHMDYFNAVAAAAR